MPVPVTVLHYAFDELDDCAKQRAIAAWREHELDYEWWEFIYDDAIRMGALMGIEIDKRRGGSGPAIFFRGFSSQGDGACFEGTYRYKTGALASLRSEAAATWTDKETGVVTTDTGNVELHRICRGLQEAQRRHFYQLAATVRHRGHYQHSGCTRIEVEYLGDQDRDITDAEGEIIDLLRDFMDWIYKRLEHEHDWRMADEQIAESIRANEGSFDEEGRRL
jgi:hypothetical protein